MVPCLVKLFSSPDRATRVKLLQQLESFVDHLQPATVNDQVRRPGEEVRSDSRRGERSGQTPGAGRSFRSDVQVHLVYHNRCMSYGSCLFY